MRLPFPRGPVTAMLVDELRRPVHDLPSELGKPLRGAAGAAVDDALDNEDLQLALYVCYELHYQGFDEVDDDWEWNPSLLALRQTAEERLDQVLDKVVVRPPAVGPEELPRTLARLAAADIGPSLAAFLQRKATREQFREFVMHRSIYHLKEADPHTWAIPRVRGRTKAALVEIQADEYGGGRPERMHAELFRATMRGLDLDDSYGAYLNAVPAITLAVSNIMSLFGLHRSRRAAILGHLAAFEMTSSIPNSRYSRGLRRLGSDAATRRFYDEHVQADAVHEQIAGHDLCGAFAAEHPGSAAEILFGAACCLTLDRLFAEHLLGRWHQERSSLRETSLEAAHR